MSKIQTNTTDFQAILNAINELPEAVEQATPVISVNNSNGLITATAGSKSATHQLAFQPAKTITPTTANQIAVSSGYFTGGAITVKGDSNLVAGNIKSGVSIFGINGTYEGSGGDTSVEDGLITGTLTSYTNSRVSRIGDYTFISNSNITSVNFPKVVAINVSAFYRCSNLTTAIFPLATVVYYSAFYSCSRLTSIVFPSLKEVNPYTFAYCSSLAVASFPACTGIFSGAFYRCLNLKSLYLTGSSLCKLSKSDAFYSTPIYGYSTSAGTYGSIYVPASLLASYKAATNWAYFSSRFVGI